MKTLPLPISSFDPGNLYRKTAANYSADDGGERLASGADRQLNHSFVSSLLCA